MSVFEASKRLALLLMSVGFACLCTSLFAGDEQLPLHLDADYPGGNIIVERVDGETVHIRQDLRDTKGWWFWWNFRVRGAEGRTLRFQFAGQSPIGVRGPALSTDGGKTWAWLGIDSVDGASFRHTFGRHETAVRFAFAVPYQRADFDNFVQAHHNQGEAHLLTVETLCKSRKGRDVPLVRIHNPRGQLQHRVLVTARHHACETMASYVLEGLMGAVFSNTDRGKWLQHHVEFIVVPFVDCDGVIDGDQGKNRIPRDHNRDYVGTSVYPETAAIRSLATGWTDRKLAVTLDLHCPWIRGRHNDVIYMVGSPDEPVKREQRIFADVLQRVQKGPLVYSAEDNLPFGTAWNTSSNYSKGKSFGRWSSGLDGVRMGTTFEIPYAEAGGTPVTAESARAFGLDLAVALSVYLSQKNQSRSRPGP